MVCSAGAAAAVPALTGLLDATPLGVTCCEVADGSDATCAPAWVASRNERTATEADAASFMRGSPWFPGVVAGGSEGALSQSWDGSVTLI